MITLMFVYAVVSKSTHLRVCCCWSIIVLFWENALFQR